MGYQMSRRQIDDYEIYLREEEKSSGTIEKYIRDLSAFLEWLKGREVHREEAVKWKEALLSCGYAPVTINSMLSSLNGFFAFAGWKECRVKFLKIQKKMFRARERELNKEEYKRLLEAARRTGKERLELLLETICGTGIRVSEVRYITMEAVRRGMTEISLKGKIRTIFLPGKLCRKLRKYAKKRRIVSGEIFITETRKPLSRQQIWREMKGICREAKVKPSKVFPHNLRHLFAVTFHRICKDVVKLADVLGHSSIETTRIYLLSTGEEHIRQVNRLGLVC